LLPYKLFHAYFIGSETNYDSGIYIIEYIWP